MNLHDENVYLDSYLAPLAKFLSQEDVTDIFINRPGEVWIETLGGDISRIEMPELSRLVLERLARQIASTNAQGINREHPLLAGSLPDGSRVQVVLPSATRGEVAMAIRRHRSVGLTLDLLDSAGAFDTESVNAAEHQIRPHSGMDWTCAKREVLRQCVQSRQTILIAGGTSTGKTTFLNALLKEIGQSERLITIEDTAEIELIHPNSVGLIASRGSMGEARICADDLVTAALRMRPDRIILGEVRGPEALTFLRAVKTGHPGSMSTIHADSCDHAIDQLALLVIQAGTSMSFGDITSYIRRTIDVVVHLDRLDGARKVRSISKLKQN